MKKVLKYVAFALAGLAAVLAVAGAVTQTGWFRERLRGFVVNAANERLEARLDIDRLDGNLFKHVELGGIRLVRESDTLLSVSSIEIDLAPRRLLARELRVDSLVIDGPRASVRRNPDGSWNFSDIVKPRPARAEEDSVNKLPLAIRLDRVALRGGALFIDSDEPAVPRAVTDIRMTFSAFWGDTAQTLALAELSFRSAEPRISLERLTCSVARTRAGLSVSDLSVRTSRNAMKGRGYYSTDGEAASSARLETEPFDLAGLEPFVPALKMHVSPAIDLDAKLVNDTLTARVGLREKRESVVLDASVYGLSKLFDPAIRDEAGYSLHGAVAALDLARWSGDSRIGVIADGTFDLRGTGVSAAGASAEGSFDFGGSTIGKIRVKDLAGTWLYASGNVTAAVDASGLFGRLAAKTSVAAVARERRFEASVEARGIDLASLTGRDSLRSQLNFAATARGSDLGRRDMTASIELRMSPSSIRRFVADTVFADADYSSGRIIARRFLARMPAGTLEASGEIGLAGRSSLTFALALGDLAALRGIVPADSIRGSGWLEGAVTGRLDSLSATGRFSLVHPAYDAWGADSAGGDFSILRGRSLISGSGTVALTGGSASGVSIDSISAALSYAGKTIDLAADVVYRDSIRARVEGGVTLGEEPVIALSSLRLELPGRTWSGGSPETRIRIEGNTYRIEGFSMYAPGSEGAGERRIIIDGAISRDGEQDLRIEASGLDIGAIARGFKSPRAVDGLLSLEAVLSGTAREPRLEGRIEVAGVLVPPFKCKSVSAAFGYGERRFTVNGFVEAVRGSRVTFEGFVPFALSLEKGGTALLENEPWELSVKADTVPVGSFSASSAAEPPVRGFIDLDLRLANTVADPELSGTCSVREGAFAVPAAGIDCKRLALGLSFAGKKITIDSLRADIGKGFIAATGSAAFDRRAASGILTDMKLDLTARNLYLERRRKFEILLSGNVTVEGTAKESKIGGAWTVEKARLFLPSLAAQGSGGRGEAPPLLVAALKQAGGDSARFSSKPKRASALKQFGELGFVKGMEGSVRISIQGGTWLRSPETNIEIGGDLDVVKNDERLELFGPIRILRGQYTLYGKRFQISEGMLTLKGGEKINPTVSVSADYEFRTTDGDDKTVTAIVTGEARSPAVRFTLEGKDITETDAISYIMVGRSAAEMAQSGGANSSASGTSSGTEIAASAAAGMLAGQLSYALGGTTNLDVLDIDTQNSWQNATVKVGKYLSPKLFVSYEAGIGQFDQDEIDPNAVTLEYRFSRLLYLQLVEGDSENSGIGFLLKYER